MHLVFLPFINMIPRIYPLLFYICSKDVCIQFQGGESTREEMCLAFITYYPATPISICSSVTNLASYYQWLADFVP